MWVNDYLSAACSSSMHSSRNYNNLCYCLTFFLFFLIQNMAFTQCTLLYILTTLWLCLLCVECNENPNFTSQLDSSFSEKCPTWYLPAKNGISTCVCGHTLHNKVHCLEDDRVSLLVGNCMTYTDNQALVGLCPYAAHDSDPVSNLYTTMPKNLSVLNEFMCGWNNRTGLLCSQCKEGLSLAVLSYEKVCMECSDKSAYLGIFVFLILIFIPTTLLFLVVIFCRIDISSGPMNAFLTIIQTSLMQINQNPANMIFKSNNPLTYYPVLFLVTFYGIWLLDFFRYIIPPFCISKSLNSMQAGALEYVIAVYPLVLIVVTYVFVELYDNENRLVTFLWTPFKRLSNHRSFKDWNIKYSLISSFATFLQLAYSKIFFISKSLINYSNVKNSSGDTIITVLQEDGSVKYMSNVHIPYFVLAVIMLTIFNVIPLLLLLLYPTRWFQLVLGAFPRINWHPLRAFMDIFHGCYKNGTDGTKDCRYFAAFHFLFRILIMFPIDNQSYSSMKLVVVPVMLGFLTALFRPYRNNVYNMWDSFCFFIYFVDQLLILCAAYDNHLSLTFLYLSHIILIVYFLLLVIAKMTKMIAPQFYGAAKNSIQSGKSLRKCLCLCRRTDGDDDDGIVNVVVVDGDGKEKINHIEVSLSLPHRLENPQEYTPLLGNQLSVNSSHYSTEISYGVQT